MWGYVGICGDVQGRIGMYVNKHVGIDKEILICWCI